MDEWMEAAACGFLRRPEHDEGGMKCWETPRGKLLLFQVGCVPMVRRTATGFEIWSRMPGQVTPDV